MNKFTAHPNEVGESYAQHFLKGMSCLCDLAVISFKLIVHAVFPFLFQFSVSDGIIKLAKEAERRRDEGLRDEDHEDHDEPLQPFHF